MHGFVLEARQQRTDLFAMFGKFNVLRRRVELNVQDRKSESVVGDSGASVKQT